MLQYIAHGYYPGKHSEPHQFQAIAVMLTSLCEFFYKNTVYCF